jgi:hypothetical protein
VPNHITYVITDSVTGEEIISESPTPGPSEHRYPIVGTTLQLTYEDLGTGEMNWTMRVALDTTPPPE